jgi:plasmid maintenance system antidote protein VapI
VLTLLIQDYEEKRYPLPHVSPNESLKALMDDRGLKHKDIWPVLGNKGAATEILNGRRSIGKAQAKRLAEFFQVPIDLFVWLGQPRSSSLLDYRINYGVEQRFTGDSGLPAVQGEPRSQARQ